MPYPAGLPTRDVSFGQAFVIEGGILLTMRVTIEASRDLIHRPTGSPLIASQTAYLSDVSGNRIVTLPVTDSGDMASVDGQPIALDSGEVTHFYTATVEYLDSDTHRQMKGVASRKIGPFVVPSTLSSPVDLDNLQVMNTPTQGIPSNILVQAGSLGVPGGVATLDDNGVLTEGQLPGGLAVLDENGWINESQVPDRLSEISLAASVASQIAAAGVGLATAGSTLTGYGPSYMVGLNATTPRSTNGFFGLVGEAGAFGAVRNRGLSGATAIENAYDALTGAAETKWTPLVDGGIVLLEPMINCVQLFGPAAKGKTAALNATRTLVALVRARAKVESSDTSFVYAGVWSTPSNAVNSGGTGRLTTEADATATYTFTGTAATVMLQAKDAAAGGTLYGPVAVSVDGGAESVRTLGDQALSFAPSSAPTARFGTPLAFAPYPVRVSGLPYGTHTIRLRNVTAGNALLVDCALLPASNPPGVVLIKDAPRPDWSSSTAGGSNAVLADYNALLDQVASEFGGPIAVADPTPGWDNATMSDTAIGNDGKHPSDAGHIHYRDAIMPKIRGLGFSPAWAGWVSGEGYSGGQDVVVTPPPTPVDPLATVDSFDRANGAPGTTSDGKATWVASGTAVHGIVSNRLKVTSGTSNGYLTFDGVSTSGTLKATLVAVSGAPSTQIAGLAFHYQDDSNGWTLQLRSTSAVVNYALVKRTAGVNAAGISLNRAPVNGDVVEVRFTPGGATVFINGSEIGSVADSAFGTATKVGFYGNGSDTVTTWDDFIFTPTA